MRILLIQPPIEDYYNTDIRLQPLGLAYLKSALIRRFTDIEVIIRDYHQGYQRKSIPLPKDLYYLKSFYRHHDKSPFSTFNQYYRFGADYDYIAEDITKLKPDFVGVSSLFSPYNREALRVAEIAKQTANCPVVAGGAHVAACPEAVLSRDYIDYIITTEGEEAIAQLIHEHFNDQDFASIPGLGFKDENRLIINKAGEPLDIDSIPFPDFSDFKLDRYTFGNRPVAFMMTSRSCPYQCSYCSVHQVFGKTYRMRSVDNIIDEMKLRYSQGYRVFDFEDDNFSASKPRVIELCNSIKSHFPNGDIKLMALNGVCYQGLDTDVLQAMKASGFDSLNLALVSSDNETRTAINRTHSAEKFIECVQTAYKLGFRITCYQILGLPGEGLQAIFETMRVMTELPVLIGASMFYLTPNTRIAETFPTPSEVDIFKSRLTAMAIETKDFSRNEIFTLFITTRIINFLKGLNLDADIQIFDLIKNRDGDDKETVLGKEILDRLLTYNELLGENKTGRFIVPEFVPEIFFQLWKTLHHITTRQGVTIYT